MQTTQPIRKLLLCLACISSLSHFAQAQQQGTWVNRTSLHIIETKSGLHAFENYNATADAVFTHHIFLGRIQSAGLDAGYIFGYKLSIGYAVLDGLELGFEQGGARSKTVVSFDYDAFSGNLNQVITPVNLTYNGQNYRQDDRVTSITEVRQNFITYTLFARKSLPYGLFAQLGASYRDWTESRKVTPIPIPTYEIVWPKEALQILLGKQWVFADFSLNLGLEAYYGQKPTLKSFTPYGVSKRHAPEGEEDYIRRSLSKMAVVHAFVLEFELQ